MVAVLQAEQKLPATFFAPIPLFSLSRCAILFDVARATPRAGHFFGLHTLGRACPRLHAPKASLLEHDRALLYCIGNDFYDYSHCRFLRNFLRVVCLDNCLRWRKSLWQHFDFAWHSHLPTFLLGSFAAAQCFKTKLGKLCNRIISRCFTHLVYFDHSPIVYKSQEKTAVITSTSRQSP